MAKAKYSLTRLFDKSKKEETNPDFNGIVLTLKIYKTPALDFHFEGNFHYLTNDNFITISTDDLPRLVKEGQITPVKQKVSGLDFEPDLFKDGFECRFLPDSIQAILNEYKNSSEEIRRNLRIKLRAELEALVSAHFSLPAVAFDTVYRNTDAKAENAFKSVSLVHIDFPETEVRKP